jgi:hypothetical protein
MDEKKFLDLSFERLSRMTDAELEASRQYAASVKQYNFTKDLEFAINIASLTGTGGAGVIAKVAGTAVSGELRTKIVIDLLELTLDSFEPTFSKWHAG